jgi:hypothetical protein
VTVEQDLVRSASMARDVIESYRQWNVTVGGWRETLHEAADSFIFLANQHPPVSRGVDLAHLARILQSIVRSQLQLIDQQSLDDVSAELRAIVSTTRIPGVPRPEDQDWSFSY